MPTTREALEAALVADPDDVARHAAYADLLIEEGDPRGEFIRLQLLLEDPDLPADRRTAIEEAADELLRRHEAEWLGPLAEYMRNESALGPSLFVTWRRGWLVAVTVRRDSLEAMHGLASDAAPCRLLRSITVAKRLGDETPTREAAEESVRGVVTTYTRVVRTESYSYIERVPPDGPARSFGGGDGAAVTLIWCGILARLDSLDLSGCDITDDGALELAACPDVRRLKSLLLDGNLISPIGVEALAAVGVTVGPQQWDAGRGGVYV